MTPVTPSDFILPCLCKARSVIPSTWGTALLQRALTPAWNSGCRGGCPGPRGRSPEESAVGRELGTDSCMCSSAAPGSFPLSVLFGRVPFPRCAK